MVKLVSLMLSVFYENKKLTTPDCSPTWTPTHFFTTLSVAPFLLTMFQSPYSLCVCVCDHSIYFIISLLDIHKNRPDYY